MFETFPEPLFLAVALFAVLITGISKSGLGGGLGQLSVPLMAVFISPVAAAAIMLPILCVIDIFNIWGYRRDFHKGNLIALLPGSIIGIAIGALTFRHVDDNMIRLILGGFSLIFSLTYFLQQTPINTDSRVGRWFGVFCGALAGYTSTIAHAGGGPVKMYLLPQRLDKRVFVATQVFFFFVVNQVKIWPYLWLGQFSTDNLTTSLILMPMVPVGVWLGWKLVRVIDGETFYRICYALLFFAGVKLIWDGLSGMGVV